MGAQGKAQSSSDLVENAARSLAMIARSVSSITDMSAMIASVAEEQSSVAAEMQSNMNNIREVADRSADGAQHTAQASLPSGFFYPLREGKKRMQNTRDSCIVFA
jgi:methyl-accepting chemotaxis protein